MMYVQIDNNYSKVADSNNFANTVFRHASQMKVRDPCRANQPPKHQVDLWKFMLHDGSRNIIASHHLQTDIAPH